jgi:hypothetical protein
MANDIVGAPFSRWVAQQIEKRETVLGKTPHAPEELLFLNNKGSWIRVASSVDIDNNAPKPFLDRYGSVASGKSLAENFVLFSGINTQGNTSTTTLGGVRPTAEFNPIEAARYSYGFGSTEYGLTPPPGIDSLKIRHINRGSLRKYDLKLKAQNLDQFELIEALYLKLGYFLLIEWGHTSYFTQDDDNNFIYQPSPEYVTPAYTEFFNANKDGVIRELQKHRKDTSGNYDGGLVKVNNFSWNFNPDGTYDITISAVSIGGLIDSLLLNYPTVDSITPSNRYELKNLTPNEKRNKAEDLGETIEDSDNADIVFKQIVSKYLAQGDFQTLLDNKIIQEEGETAGGESLDTITFDDFGQVVFVDQYKTFLNQHLIENIVKLKKTPWKQIDGKDRYKTLSGNNLISIKFNNGDSKKSDREAFYMKLGPLLDHIQEGLKLNVNENSTTEQRKNSKSPLYIKTVEQYMFTHWFQNSANPQVCLVPFKVKDPETQETITPLDDILGTSFLDKGDAKNNDFAASLYDIHVNFEFIASTLRNTEANDENNNITLYGFLTNLMDGIQLALGDINKFSVIYNEDSNYILIQDDTKIDGQESTEQPPTPIRAYGVNVNDSKGSFVKNISMTSQITPKLATELAIGSAASGNDITNSASLLSRWNAGFTDRCHAKDTEAQTNNPSGRDLLDTLKSKYKLYFDYLKSSFIDFNAPTTPDINTALASLPSLLEYDLGIKTINGEIDGKGFIPINLSVTVDGLSGVLLFQKFSLTPNILPPTYSEGIDFVVKSIDHTIIGNEWTTSYGTISVPRFRPTENQTSKSSSPGTEFSLSAPF